MKLLEHQAKAQFRNEGIECPMGRVARTPGEAESAARELGEAVVKAQVPATELLRYANDLRSITSGTATFTRNFARYEPVLQGAMT